MGREERGEEERRASAVNNGVSDEDFRCVGGLSVLPYWYLGTGTGASYCHITPVIHRLHTDSSLPIPQPQFASGIIVLGVSVPAYVSIQVTPFSLCFPSQV